MKRVLKLVSLAMVAFAMIIVPKTFSWADKTYDITSFGSKTYELEQDKYHSYFYDYNHYENGGPSADTFLTDKKTFEYIFDDYENLSGMTLEEFCNEYGKLKFSFTPYLIDEDEEIFFYGFHIETSEQLRFRVNRDEHGILLENGKTVNAEYSFDHVYYDDLNAVVRHVAAIFYSENPDAHFSFTDDIPVEGTGNITVEAGEQYFEAERNQSLHFNVRSYYEDATVWPGERFAQEIGNITCSFWVSDIEGGKDVYAYYLEISPLYIDDETGASTEGPGSFKVELENKVKIHEGENNITFNLEGQYIPPNCYIDNVYLYLIPLNPTESGVELPNMTVYPLHSTIEIGHIIYIDGISKPEFTSTSGPIGAFNNMLLRGNNHGELSPVSFDDVKWLCDGEEVNVEYFDASSFTYEGTIYETRTILFPKKGKYAPIFKDGDTSLKGTSIEVTGDSIEVFKTVDGSTIYDMPFDSVRLLRVNKEIDLSELNNGEVYVAMNYPGMRIGDIKVWKSTDAYHDDGFSQENDISKFLTYENVSSNKDNPEERQIYKFEFKDDPQSSAYAVSIEAEIYNSRNAKYNFYADGEPINTWIKYPYYDINTEFAVLDFVPDEGDISIANSWLVEGGTSNVLGYVAYGGITTKEFKQSIEDDTFVKFNSDPYKAKAMDPLFAQYRLSDENIKFFYTGSDGVRKEAKYSFEDYEDYDYNLPTENDFTIVQYCDEEYTETALYFNKPGKFEINYKGASAYIYYIPEGKNEYEITYNLDPDVVNYSNPSKYFEGDTYTFKAPERVGYKFLGWYTDSALKNKIEGISKSTKGNLFLWAKWEKIAPKQYNITYHLNGGTNSAKNPATYVEGVGVASLEAPSRKGYDFDGWYTEATFKNRIKSIGTNYCCDIDIYAKWKNSYVSLKGKKYTVSGITYKVLEDNENGSKTVSITKAASATKIPSSVTIEKRKFTVIEIADNAFKGNKKISSASLGNSVTKIGKNAFNGCKLLKTVKLGKNVASIGASAFQNCSSLKSVTLNDKLSTIGDKAFYGLTGLTKITIPAKVTKIGKSAFEKCKALNSITIKTTLLSDKSVGSKAFASLSSTAKIKVPKKSFTAYTKWLKKKGFNGKKQKITK